MKLATSAKVFLAILAACAAALVANGIASRISFERDFMGYLNDQSITRMKEALPTVRSAYIQQGSWDFVRQNPQAWFEILRPQPLADPTQEPAFLVSDQTGAIPRLALLDAHRLRLAGNPEIGPDAFLEPITDAQGSVVGWLAMAPFQKALAAGDVRFYKAQLRSWWINGGVCVLIAAVLAGLFSRALVRRISAMKDAIHRLAIGDYARRVQTGGDDEFGRLAADINRLADALESTEQNRRSFMADISHELRTPLAVLRAEMEAIQDGIRPMTQEALEPLNHQIHQLGKLIDDLHELAMTKTGELSYRFEPTDLGNILELSVSIMRQRLVDAGLTLVIRPSMETASKPMLIHGDERRLDQLFCNLLENSARYTDAGGQVVIETRQHIDRIEIVLEDSAPGIAPEHLDRLFDRFYRVDASRNRASGGSGLGLAICRNIVEAHHGTIAATASPLGGLRLRMTFPGI